MWDIPTVAAYMTRKGIKRPGGYRADNQHAGRMWASRKECPITDQIAGTIIEKVYESRLVTLEQLKLVRHSLSYAYYLKTGNGGENWPEVKAQWRSFKPTTLPKSTTRRVPTRIPTPLNNKNARLKQWTPDCGMNLAEFMVAQLADYDTHVFGLRSNVDINKVKKSVDHDIVANEGYGWTEMKDGRSKLHLSKRGTRPWKVYRVCTCKGAHKTPSGRAMYVRKDGNPRRTPKWNTTCPVAAMEFIKYHSHGETWRCYPRWIKEGKYGKQNYGDVPSLANRWLTVQGQYADEEQTAFDRNSGRKSLARWLAHLRVPYRDSLHIHGDLECVWRHSYQGGLSRSHYRVREQSTDPDTATKALLLFAKWLHETNQQPTMTFKERLKEFMETL